MSSGVGLLHLRLNEWLCRMRLKLYLAVESSCTPANEEHEASNILHWSSIFMVFYGVQNGLQAATSSLQAVQNAHKAEIAFIESEKETDMVAVKATAVKRVKQLIAELDCLKMGNGDISRSCATLGADGCHPCPCPVLAGLLPLT